MITFRSGGSHWKALASLAASRRRLAATVTMCGSDESVIAVSSPRTSTDLIEAAPVPLLPGRRRRVFSALLRLPPRRELHLTTKCLMLSDAVASGKPVGMIGLEPDWIGKWVRVLGSLRGRPLRVRDLTKFWTTSTPAVRRTGRLAAPGKPRRRAARNCIGAIRSAMEDRLQSGRASPAVRPAAPQAAAQPVAG